MVFGSDRISALSVYPITTDRPQGGGVPFRGDRGRRWCDSITQQAKANNAVKAAKEMLNNHQVIVLVSCHPQIIKQQ